MSADNLTILVAIAAGLLSFLSPCVLPLVPAYIGQLTAVAVAEANRAGSSGAGALPVRAAGPSRWTAFRHALAYVGGFGVVFTLLGVTATFAAAGLSPWMPVLRQVGGVILVLLGLNLAGVLRIPALDRNWRPLMCVEYYALGTSGAIGGSVRGARLAAGFPTGRIGCADE